MSKQCVWPRITAVSGYIKGFHNTKRTHSALRYQTSRRKRFC